MKRKAWLFIMAGAFLLSAGPLLAQDFYVIAGGGPPVGTKITSLPYPIKNPGFYYLTGNLSYSGTSDGITVSVDDVTIDLMGFRIIGPGSSSGFGIRIDGRKNVEVRNGTLSGWSAAFIDSTTGGFRDRALNLRVENCNFGIQFLGIGNLVQGCTLETVVTGIFNGGGVTTGNTANNSASGIIGTGTIGGNFINNCSSNGIDCRDGSSIIGNTVITTAATQTGITINTANNVLVTQNTVSGPGTHFTPGGATINVNNAF